MAFQHQDLPDSAFVINDVVIENIRNYKGKDRYTTTLIIDSEEVEIVADDIVEESFDEEYFDAWALEEEAEGTDIVVSEPEAVEESVTTEITEDSNNQ